MAKGKSFVDDVESVAEEVLGSIEAAATRAAELGVHELRVNTGNELFDFARAVAHHLGQTAEHSPIGAALLRLGKSLGL